jgi:hypothetical protein
MIVFHFLKAFYTLLFVWLCAVIAAFAYRRVLPAVFRQFIVFIILMAAAETIGNFLAFRNIHNHYYFNVFFALEFMMVPYFFYFQLTNQFLKKFILAYFVIFPLFFIVNFTWWQSFDSLLTYTFVLGGSFILVLSVTYIWQLYSSDETQNVFRDPVFWFSLGYLFYYTIAVPYLGQLNYLWKDDPSFTKKYYLIFNIVIILHNILLSTGFLCARYLIKKQS